ncbi:BP74-related protein [Rhodohalobacter sp. 614A]|uniref:BP74-related protein n=1 Tax=Rhodohalobacter sp. 614A TaxID=2908649 RepID=UPI001F28550A|nr:hypothetical protein [Rhodohalobacter sp. 614A]
MNFSRKAIYLITILLLAFFTACSTNTDDDNDARYYEFTHENDDISYTIVAKTSEPEVISAIEDELQKPFDERNMHINGEIARGNEGYNSDWSWHFIENQWSLAEISTEVCDGRPGFVEDDLDYWVDQVGNFCPWSAHVVGEVNP